MYDFTVVGKAQVAEMLPCVWGVSTNATIGDFAGNIQQIIDAVQYIIANLKTTPENNEIHIITPELSLCGYPPGDLLIHTDFVARAEAALNELCEQLKEISTAKPLIYRLFVGNVERVDVNNKPYNNVANVAYELLNGEIVRKYAKRDLPNYSVFDEKRTFIDGISANICYTSDKASKHVALAICEDIWNDTPLDVGLYTKSLYVMNASPYRHGIASLREQTVVKVRAKYPQLENVVYVNALGGNDELVFDGFGFKHTYQACVQGLRDYVQKNFGEKGEVVLGLSGGIDSALCATIAVDALGADKVTGILMPSQYSSEHSITDAMALAENLGIKAMKQPISALFDTYTAQLDDLSEIAKQNIQARIRGNILMAHSNSVRDGKVCVVIATGNKSELAVGYSTIYGDAVGGYAPIKDILKTQVWELAQWRNALSSADLAYFVQKHGFANIVQPIPENSITKPPSAELAPGQLDQDTLPDYAVLDEIIDYLMDTNDESFGSSQSIRLSPEIDNETVERVAKMLKNAQWKRLQYPMGPKISKVSFGKDWRLPVTYASSLL